MLNVALRLVEGAEMGREKALENPMRTTSQFYPDHLSLVV